MQTFHIDVLAGGQPVAVKATVSDAVQNSVAVPPYACSVQISPLLDDAVLLFGDTPPGAASNAFAFVDAYLREKFGDGGGTLTYRL